MKNRGIKSIVVNASYIFASHGITILTRAFYAVILARFLGPEIYGIYNYGFAWYLTFMPITMLGLNFILSREIASRRPGYEKTVAQTLALRSIASVLIALLCGSIGWYIETEAIIRQIIIVFSFALFGRGLSLWADSVFIAYEKSHFLLRQNSIFRFLEIIIGISVLFADKGVIALALVHAVIYWAQGLYGLTLVRRHLLPVYPDWNFKAILRLLRIGIPFLFSLVFLAWLTQGPVIMYRYFGGLNSNNLGQLALGMQGLFMLKGIPAALSSAALPVLNRSVERKDGKDRIYIEGMLRIGLILGAITGISAMVLSPLLIPLIFGEQYRHTGDLLGPILWLLTPIICTSAMAQVIIARGRYRQSALCYGAGALTLLAVFPYFVEKYDTYGVVMALGVAYLVLAICQKITLYRIAPFNIKRAFFRPLLSVLAALGIYYQIKPVNIYMALAESVTFLILFAYITGVLSKSEKTGIKNSFKGKLNKRRKS